MDNLDTSEPLCPHPEGSLAWAYWMAEYKHACVYTPGEGHAIWRMYRPASNRGSAQWGSCTERRPWQKVKEWREHSIGHVRSGWQVVPNPHAPSASATTTEQTLDLAEKRIKQLEDKVAAMRQERSDFLTQAMKDWRTVRDLVHGPKNKPVITLVRETLEAKDKEIERLRYEAEQAVRLFQAVNETLLAIGAEGPLEAAQRLVKKHTQVVEELGECHRAVLEYASGSTVETVRRIVEQNKELYGEVYELKKELTALRGLVKPVGRQSIFSAVHDALRREEQAKNKLSDLQHATNGLAPTLDAIRVLVGAKRGEATIDAVKRAIAPLQPHTPIEGSRLWAEAMMLRGHIVCTGSCKTAYLHDGKRFISTCGKWLWQGDAMTTDGWRVAEPKPPTLEERVAALEARLAVD